jgi:hypothetical protein
LGRPPPPAGVGCAAPPPPPQGAWRRPPVQRSRRGQKACPSLCLPCNAMRRAVADARNAAACPVNQLVIGCPAAGRGWRHVIDPARAQQRGAVGAVGAGGRGCWGGHDAAGAEVLHGLREPCARPGALGGAGVRCLLGGSLMAGRRRRWCNHDGRGGSNSGDVVVCGCMP